MPIASYKPDVTPLPQKPVIPVITEPEYKGIVIDSKYQPLNSLIKYVAGSNWVCNSYYSQILDTSDDVRPVDLGESAIYQGYRKINNLELKVTSALSDSQDSQTNLMTVTGAAHILSYLIPNTGDMFIADVGDGRLGIFQVTSSQKVSILKESVYLIEYTLTSFVDQNPAKLADLEEKTVQEFYYEKDLINTGTKPIIIKSEYQKYRELETIYKRMVNHYMENFYNEEFKTITVPGQSNSVYDYFVACAATSIMSSDDHLDVRYIRRLNVGDDSYMKQPTFYDALMKQDPDLLQTSNRAMGGVRCKSFNSDAMLESIRFSNIEHCIYPKNPNKKSNYPNIGYDKAITLNSLLNVTPAKSTMSDSFNITETISLPFVTSFDITSYVVSDSCYDLEDPKSVFEKIVIAFFKDENLNTTELYELAKRYSGWGLLEQFYYIPVILLLIRYARANISR